MPIRTGLDMAAKRCGATLHDGVGGSAHVGGQGLALLIGRKRVLEDRLERDERHQCLRTSGIRASSGCFVQYHANYPRCKRLVQPLLEATVGAEYCAAICHFQIICHLSLWSMAASGAVKETSVI